MTEDTVAYLTEFRRRLGLPAIVDVHTHFMPDQVMRKVWAYFDSAGPLTGREWPIAYRDDQAVRAVVLTHTGGTFCAGADLSEAGRTGPEVMIDLMRSIIELPKPVIGRIVSGSVAEQAGLQTGDLILSANGKPIFSWDALVELVRRLEAQREPS